MKGRGCFSGAAHAPAETFRNAAIFRQRTGGGGGREEAAPLGQIKQNRSGIFSAQFGSKDL